MRARRGVQILNEITKYHFEKPFCVEYWSIQVTVTRLKLSIIKRSLTFRKIKKKKTRKIFGKSGDRTRCHCNGNVTLMPLHDDIKQIGDFSISALVYYIILFYFKYFIFLPHKSNTSLTVR